MTRTSKIARLPKSIRHQLSLRIEDNHSGVEIVQWLNSLPDVQKITAEQFTCKPISEQNVSDWKSSGHLDWLRHEDAREAALHLLETSDDLDQVAQYRSLAGRFAAILATQLFQAGMVLAEKEADPEKKWKLLCQLNRELSRIRRDDDRTQRTTLEPKGSNPGPDRQPHDEPRPSKPEAGSNLVTMALNNLGSDYDPQVRLPGSVLAPETLALLSHFKFSNRPASTLQPSNASTSFLDKPQQNGKNPA